MAPSRPRRVRHVLSGPPSSGSMPAGLALRRCSSSARSCRSSCGTSAVPADSRIGCSSSDARRGDGVQSSTISANDASVAGRDGWRNKSGERTSSACGDETPVSLATTAREDEVQGSRLPRAQKRPILRTVAPDRDEIGLCVYPLKSAVLSLLRTSGRRRLSKHRSEQALCEVPCAGHTAELVWAQMDDLSLRDAILQAESEKREAIARSRTLEELAASDERRVRDATAEFLAAARERGWVPSQMSTAYDGWVLRSYQPMNREGVGHHGIALTSDGVWLVCRLGAWQLTDHPVRDCVSGFPPLGDLVPREQGPPYCDPAAQLTRFFARLLVSSS